jgi:hypothetical protein
VAPLTTDQVGTAMLRLAAHWPGKSLTAIEAAEWRRQLARLEQGEFLPTLDAWIATATHSFRPDLSAFMGLARSRRPRAAAWTPEPRVERSERSVEIITTIHAALRGDAEAKRELAKVGGS